MKTFIILIISLFTFSVHAQESETRNLSNFSGISGKSGVQIIYHQSNTPKVILKTDSKENLQYVFTEIKNNVLDIYIDTKNKENIKISKVEINVFGSDLEKISMSSGAKISFENTMNSNQLFIEQSSGSQIKFNEIIAKNIDINLSSGAELEGKFSSNIISSKMSSGSIWNAKINSKELSINSSSGSKVLLEGTTEKLSIKAASGAMAELNNLKTEEADIVANNGSKITSWVCCKLSAEANTSGKIIIKGLPTNLKIKHDKLSKISNENGDVY